MVVICIRPSMLLLTELDKNHENRRAINISLLTELAVPPVLGRITMSERVLRIPCSNNFERKWGAVERALTRSEVDAVECFLPG